LHLEVEGGVLLGEGAAVTPLAATISSTRSASTTLAGWKCSM
jgi:hypothetical protein